MHSHALYAQETFPSKILLNVRAIRGVGLVDENELEKRKNVLIDVRLRDLEQELRSLPFRIYQLLDSSEHQIVLKKKQEYHLITGHVLDVRLLSFSEEGVWIWVKWTDKKGGMLLDTRMHLVNGQPLLAGAENLDKSGTVLAIVAKVKP